MRDTFALIIDFVRARRWLLAFLPLLFVVFFFAALSGPYQGTLTTADYSYKGRILNDAPEGYGKMTYKNGDSYTGGFKGGKFNAKGTFTSKAGNWQYTGLFVDGVADGKGEMTTSDGKKQAVSFKNGVVSP